MKVVHHDRLSPVRSTEENEAAAPQPRRRVEKPVRADDTGSSDSESCSDTSDNASDWEADRESLTSSSDSGDDGADNDANVDDRRYPLRERTPRVIPGAIPWNAVPTM